MKINILPHSRVQLRGNNSNNKMYYMGHYIYKTRINWNLVWMYILILNKTYLSKVSLIKF
jgi:hypothetical protein